MLSVMLYSIMPLQFQVTYFTMQCTHWALSFPSYHHRNCQCLKYHPVGSIYYTKTSDSKQNSVHVKHMKQTQKKTNPYLRLFHDLDTEHMVFHRIDNYKNITKFCWNYSSSIISSMFWPDNVYFIIS